MFSHAFIGVSDFERAFAFYEPLMRLLGAKMRFCDRSRPWAGWQPDSAPRPLLLIGRPFDGTAHHAGNGQMLAFLTLQRSTVDEAYVTALALGGRCGGAPGLRLEYHENYYGAYFRDPDANKLCVVCHESRSDSPQDDAEHGR